MTNTKKEDVNELVSDHESIIRSIKTLIDNF